MTCVITNSVQPTIFLSPEIAPAGQSVSMTGTKTFQPGPLYVGLLSLSVTVTVSAGFQFSRNAVCTASITGCAMPLFTGIFSPVLYAVPEQLPPAAFWIWLMRFGVLGS